LEGVWKLSAHHHGLGAITSVELDNGDAYAIDKVVNAVGPAAPSVAALVARNVPMRNRPGLAVTNGDIGDGCAAGNRDHACRVSRGLIDDLSRSSSSLAEGQLRIAGLPLDGRPLIGRASDISGYYGAVTHSGITLGPILARALTAEILRDQIDPLVSGFHASRFR
jgi:glycine/D-amino acid oxidase-like deaminating enzyme